MTKVYFISGANRGIGFNFAKVLAQRPDVKVITTARNVETAKELAELKAETGNIEILQLDVSSEQSIDALDAQLKKVAPDGIDVFISNAGISDAYSTVLDAPRSIWTKHYTTNVLGPIFLYQALYPYLAKKETKQIVFISSSAGSIGAYFPFSVSAYGQSKAALNYTVKEISSELDGEGFTVISVHPGLVTTDMGSAGIVSLSAGSLSATAIATLNAFGIELDANDDLGEKFKAFAITPEESANKQIALFDKLTREDNGKFLNYDGTDAFW